MEVNLPEYLIKITNIRETPIPDLSLLLCVPKCIEMELTTIELSGKFWEPNFLRRSESPIYY